MPSSPRSARISRRRVYSVMALTPALTSTAVAATTVASTTAPLGPQNFEPASFLAATRRTASSPLLPTVIDEYTNYPSYTPYTNSDDDADTEADHNPGGHVLLARWKSKLGMRSRTAALKAINTGHGTETEDEPVPNLPTARLSDPAMPEQNHLHILKLTPLLFHSLRMLAPIPALLGTLINLYHLIHPPPRSEFNRSTRADYIAAAAWSVLTGVQCLYFTTGLLTRWKAYYPLLPTLIRLLGLQAICWPATHYTHVFLQYDGHHRPLLCWTVIGTTTCITRSIQMWVTSNIWEWDHPNHPNHHIGSQTATISWGEKSNEKWRGRKWDWNEVIWKCAFPAGVCYFIASWAMFVSRELYNC